MIEITLYLMNISVHWIGIKAIAKVRQRATFKKHPLDNKLFKRCYTLKSIFIAKNSCICKTNVTYLHFMLPAKAHSQV